MKINILIIDDDILFAESLSQELNDTNEFQSDFIEGPNQMKEIKKNNYQNIFIDLRLKNTSGLNHIQEIKEMWPKADIYLMTGFGTIATAVSAIKLGATEYLTKPITVEKIKNVLNSIEASDENEKLTTPLSLDRVEREYIEHILVQEKGNITKAAQKLGLHRQSLQRKLKKWVP
jgi:two-component system response regulator RegA